jgi:TolB protein
MKRGFISICLGLASLCGACTGLGVPGMGAAPSATTPTSGSGTGRPIDLSALPGRLSVVRISDLNCGRWCDGDIFIMRPDGGDLTPLTHGPQHDSSSVLSPDGSRVAFSRLDPETHLSDLYVVDTDGGNFVRVPVEGTDDLAPQWSPDSTHLVFERNPEGSAIGAETLWTIDLSSGVLDQITGGTSTDASFADFWPSWSPSGAIVFDRWSSPPGRSDSQCIVSISSHRVTCSLKNGWYENPRWSPDGSRIAFSNTVDGNTDLYVMDADGTHVLRLTDELAEDRYPTWSPNGRFIAFSTGSRYAGWAIAIIRADGSGRTLLPGTHEGYPSWGPG